MDTSNNSSEAPPIDKMETSDHHEEMDEARDPQQQQQPQQQDNGEIRGGENENEEDAESHDEHDHNDGNEELDKMEEDHDEEGDHSDEEEGSEPAGEEGNEASGEEEMEDNDEQDSEDDDDNDGSDDEESEEDESEEDKNLDKTLQQDRSATKTKKKERYHVPKIYQDAITVLIPLDVTADLRVAVQHTRDKRIKSIYKTFPALEKEAKKRDDKESDAQMTGEEDDENAKESEGKKSGGKKKLEHIPQPEQFGSVLDYLEAKYVKGVMLDENEEEGPNLDDKSEGQGSVYSKDSFLDDTDLQLDVAEQVMASTTLTKMELEQDDGDFFVNVGNLEVENDDYGENYNPLLDKENTKATKKKRKKSTTSAASAAGAGTPAKKKKKTPAKAETPSSAKSAKSKKSTATAASTKTTKSTTTKKSTTKSSTTPKNQKSSSGTEEQKKAVKRTKARADSLYKKAVTMIKNMTAEELPKRKTKLKVALTCPPNKKPGDDITFSNPHDPGQRLRVKVPKDCSAGSTFKVTVPVKVPKDEEGKDHNKLSRDFKGLLDDFARAYDDWLAAKHEIHPEQVKLWKEKQLKFDKLAKEFPSNLMTPVDPAYLKLAMRRERQNKSKRKKPVPEAKVDETEEDEEEEEEEATPKRVVDIPGMGKSFASVKWKESDFM